jgi:hypothetical protein
MEYQCYKLMYSNVSFFFLIKVKFQIVIVNVFITVNIEHF